MHVQICASMTTINFTFSSLQQETLDPRASLVSSFASPRKPLRYFLSLGICLSQIFYEDGIIHLSFPHWYTSLSIIFSVVIHGACLGQYFIHCMPKVIYYRHTLHFIFPLISLMDICVISICSCYE